jgi:hypothetical protein
MKSTAKLVLIPIVTIALVLLEVTICAYAITQFADCFPLAGMSLFFVAIFLGVVIILVAGKVAELV